MAKEDLISYLNETLDNQLYDYDWAIEWYKKEKWIVVYVTLFAETTFEKIEDVDGTIAENQIIEFEDTLVFYDLEKMSPDECLKAIPFVLKKGLEKGYLQTMIAYLKEVLDVGQSDLLDFATDETIEEFELKWDDTVFENNLAIAKESGRYNKEFVPYPKF